MTKEQKEKRYTELISIESFIHIFKLKFVESSWKSVEEVRDYSWTDEELSEKSKPLVKLFTEGFCYYFALMLKGAYPGGHVCLVKGHGHIVYLYRGKFYDINGERTNHREKYIPIEYFGELMGDFKHNLVYSFGATKSEIKTCIEHAKADNNILTKTHNIIHCISNCWREGNVNGCKESSTRFDGSFRTYNV